MTRTLEIPPDLAPTAPEERTWTWVHYSSLWMGSVHNIPSYAAVAGFFALGLSVTEVIGVILTAALCIAFLLTTNGVAGAKYGLPHPIVLQWIYGKYGARIPGVLRGLLAGVMWFGLQTYAGSTALLLLLTSFFPSFPSWGPDGTILGLSFMEASCFLLFLGMTLLIGWGGTRWIGPLTKMTTLMIVLVFSYLGTWSFLQSGGWNALFIDSPSDASSPYLLIACVSALTATWIAPIVSSADMTRYATHVRASVVGQWVGLLATYGLFVFTSISLIKGMEIQWGVQLVNIVDILPYVESPLVRYLSLLTIVLATLSVNTLGNMIPAANQLTSLFPRWLNFRTSLLVLAFVSTAFMPWRLLESSTSLLFFLNLIGAMLAPVIGVMLSHFYLVRKQTISLIHVDKQVTLPEPDTFQTRLAVSVSVITGSLCLIGSFVPMFAFFYETSVFTGLLVSALVYTVCMKLFGTRAILFPIEKSLP